MLFSNKIKNSLKVFSVLLVFSLVSCSYFFEPKEEPLEADISSNDTQCLTQTTKVFSRFFKNMSEEKSLDGSLESQSQCLQNAVLKFSTYVKSGEGDGKSYNAQEVLNVLNIFFKDESLSFDLSLSFIEDFLKIKEFLVGGSSKQLTKFELLKLQKFIDVLSGIFLSVRPYREVLLEPEYRLPRTIEGRDKFDEAFKELKGSVDKVLNLTKNWGSRKPFDLSKAGEFLLKLYYKDSFDERRDYLRLYIEFKKMALNEDHSLIERKDFDFLVHQTLRVYQTVSEYNHFVEDGALFNGLGSLACFIVKVPQQLRYAEVLNTLTYDSLGRIYDRSAKTLIRAAQRGSQKRIDMSKVGGLLAAMEKVGFLGKNLTAESLTFFISSLVKGWVVDKSLKIPSPSQSARDYQPYFTENKILYILKHIRGWQTRQEFINKIMVDKDSINLDKIKMEGLSSEIKDWIYVLKKINLKRWARVDSGRVDSFRLLFTKNDQRLNYKELTANNSIYTEIRFFMQPFQSHDGNIMTYTVSEKQTQTIYELMRPIGIELAFMDSRIYDTGHRAFLEANLFSTVKASDKKINLYEGFELMSYLYNSGMLSEEIYDSIPDDFKLDDLDVLRKKLIKPSDFRKFIFENYMQYFLQLPSLQKHWSSLSAAGREEFVHVLEKAARGGVISDTAFDMGAVRIMVAVTYYLESFFYNFESDKDDNNVAYGEELVAAEKHFHDHLHIIAEKNQNKGREVGDSDWESFNEDYVDNLFYSILYYKEIPDPDSWSNWWTVGLANSRQKISRSDVLHVFSILSDVSRKGSIERIQKFLSENQKKLLEEVEKTRQVPNCQKNKVLFCEWARVLQCNADVYEHLFRQMKVSKNRFHSLEEVDKTIESLADWMREDDILLQTKCTYPHIRNKKKDIKKKKKETGGALAPDDRRY